MTSRHLNEAYRRPYRRGDYQLVDTTRAGTYWKSPEGLVVRMASAESERAVVRTSAPAWSAALTLLTGRLAGRCNELTARAGE